MRTRWGNFPQHHPRASVALGITIKTRIRDGMRVSRRGANHRAAIKPRTTDGSEAMISMVDFT